MVGVKQFWWGPAGAYVCVVVILAVLVALAIMFRATT